MELVVGMFLEVELLYGVPVGRVGRMCCPRAAAKRRSTYICVSVFSFLHFPSSRFRNCGNCGDCSDKNDNDNINDSNNDNYNANVNDNATISITMPQVRGPSKVTVKVAVEVEGEVKNG